MSEYYSGKIDFIIMIILALMVAFIIGFNILQLIDSKLSSVVINVPPAYPLSSPPQNLKQINLEETETKSNIVPTEQKIEGFTDYNESNYYVYNKEKENFGNIPDYPLIYDDNRRHLISSVLVQPKANEIIEQQTIYQTATNPNSNTVNDIPLLIAPDTNVPNRAGLEAKGYYASRVKLIEDSNSPLMKLAKSNADKINSVVKKCTLADSKKIPEINGTFDGYNAFVDLRTDSYANITSIGKSMLTPYVSYPVPS